MLGGRRDHVARTARAGQRPGGVVDHHDVDLAGLDRGLQRLQRLPLRGVPAVAAHDHGRSAAPSTSRASVARTASRSSSRMTSTRALDVRQQPRPADRPGEHAAAGQRQQHLVGVVAGAPALARGEHDQRRARTRDGDGGRAPASYAGRSVCSLTARRSRLAPRGRRPATGPAPALGHGLLDPPHPHDHRALVELHVVVGQRVVDRHVALEHRARQHAERHGVVAGEVARVGSIRPRTIEPPMPSIFSPAVSGRLACGADLGGPVLGGEAGTVVEHHLVDGERRLEAGQVVGAVEREVRPVAHLEVGHLVVDVGVLGADHDEDARRHRPGAVVDDAGPLEDAAVLLEGERLVQRRHRGRRARACRAC